MSPLTIREVPISTHALTKDVFLVVDINHPAYGTAIRKVCEIRHEAQSSCCEGEKVIEYIIIIDVNSGGENETT